MTTEERLWNKFIEVEQDIAQLKYIIQNPIDGSFPIDPIYIQSWRDRYLAAIEKLRTVSKETYRFLEVNNAKDI